MIQIYIIIIIYNDSKDPRFLIIRQDVIVGNFFRFPDRIKNNKIFR